MIEPCLSKFEMWKQHRGVVEQFYQFEPHRQED